MGRTGSQKGESLPVTEHYRAPFNSIAARPLFGTIPGELYAPKMPAIDVVAIRIEENCFLVRGERPLLDFAVARGEQLRFSTVRRKRVQMLPAVFFRSNHQLIASGPIDDAAAGIALHIGVGSLRCGTAMPDFFCRACRRVGCPDGPEMRFVRSDEIS